MRLDIALLLIAGYKPLKVASILGVSSQLVYFYKKEIVKAEDICISLRDRKLIDVYKPVFK